MIMITILGGGRGREHFGGALKVRPRRGEGRGGGTLKNGAPKGGGPKISRFFSFSFFSLLGLHTTARELQTCTFQGPGLLKTPPKFNKRTPKRGKKENCGGRGKKKSEILDSPPFGAPPFGAPLFA